MTPKQPGLSSFQVPEIAPEPRDQISGFYKDLLGREADTEGLNSWVNAYKSGTSLDDIRQGFMNSPEYMNRRPEVTPPYDPRNDISNMYRTILGREADTEGLNSWMNAYNSGTSIDDIRQGFIGSPEYQNRAMLPTEQLQNTMPVNNPVYSGPSSSTSPGFNMPSTNDMLRVRSGVPFTGDPGFSIPAIFPSEPSNNPFFPNEKYKPAAPAKMPFPLFSSGATNPFLAGISDATSGEQMTPTFTKRLPYNPTYMTTEEDMRPTTPRPNSTSGLSFLSSLFGRRFS